MMLSNIAFHSVFCILLESPSVYIFQSPRKTETNFLPSALFKKLSSEMQQTMARHTRRQTPASKLFHIIFSIATMVQTYNQNLFNYKSLQRLNQPWRYQKPYSRIPSALDFRNARSTPDRASVEAYIRTTPRFLFRVSRPTSGGPHSINSKDEIIPNFFHQSRTLDIPDYPPSYSDFYKTHRQQLALRAKLHLREFDGFDTPFSSWTQSFVWAINYYRRDNKDLQLSVLDTSSPAFDAAKTPALSATNLGKVVGYDTRVFRQRVPREGQSFADIPGYEHELLAFGAIRAPA